MDFQKLTIKSQEAFSSAQGIALERGNPEITPDHLLVALLDQDASVAGRVLEKAGHSAAAVRAAADERVSRLPRVEGGNATPPASRALRDTLEAAFTEAETLKDEYVAVEHLLLALAKPRRAGSRRHHEGAGGGARRAAGELARRRGHLRGARASSGAT